LAAYAETLRQIKRERDALVLVSHHLAIEFDPTRKNKLLHLAPRAVTEVGEQPV
jgi:hypothetical protein